MSAQSLPIPLGPIAVSCTGQSNMRRWQRGSIIRSLVTEGFEPILTTGSNVNGIGLYDSTALSDSLVLDSDLDGLNVTRGLRYESQYDDGAGGGRLRVLVDQAKANGTWPKGKVPMLHCQMQSEADSAPEAYANAHPNWMEALFGFLVEDFPEFDWYFCVGLPWFDPARDPLTSFVETVRSGLIAKAATHGWGIVDSKAYPRITASGDDVHLVQPYISQFADRFASVAKTGTNIVDP